MVDVKPGATVHQLGKPKPKPDSPPPAAVEYHTSAEEQERAKIRWKKNPRAMQQQAQAHQQEVYRKLADLMMILKGALLECTPDPYKGFVIPTKLMNRLTDADDLRITVVGGERAEQDGYVVVQLLRPEDVLTKHQQSDEAPPENDAG